MIRDIIVHYLSLINLKDNVKIESLPNNIYYNNQ